VYELTRRGQHALEDRRAIWQRFSEAVAGLLAGAPTQGKPA
jgi:DNA-binding PadR family transcriptional regulator